MFNRTDILGENVTILLYLNEGREATSFKGSTF